VDRFVRISRILTTTEGKGTKNQSWYQAYRLNLKNWGSRELPLTLILPSLTNRFARFAFIWTANWYCPAGTIIDAFPFRRVNRKKPSTFERTPVDLPLKPSIEIFTIASESGVSSGGIGVEGPTPGGAVGLGSIVATSVGIEVGTKGGVGVELGPDGGVGNVVGVAVGIGNPVGWGLAVGVGEVTGVLVTCGVGVDVGGDPLVNCTTADEVFDERTVNEIEPEV
jgi:hypothetical protein